MTLYRALLDISLPTIVVAVLGMPETIIGFLEYLLFLNMNKTQSNAKEKKYQKSIRLINTLDAKDKIDNIIFKKKNTTSLSGVSITQLAENGTIYKKKEILEISKICKNYNMFLHMDGARFANALVSQNISPAEATWKLGVDCLSLGATKNGAMAAEVIIFFNNKLAFEAKNKIKQTGHVISKTRFISAQLNAWFKDGLWIKLAKSANNNAKYLSDQLSLFRDFKLLYPTEGNEVFLKIENKTYDQILKLKIIPNLWSKVNDDELVIRFVTSFETQKSQIDELIKRLSNQFIKT